MWKWIESFIGLLFPRCCIVCNGPVSIEEKFICVECLANIPRTNFHLQKNNFVEQYFWGQIPIVKATSFMHYSKGGDYNRILHHLKYYKCKEIGEFMGEIIASEIKESGFFEGIDLIIPVPLHKIKEKKRGYNQSNWLAKGISAVTGISTRTNLLTRNINNPTQTKKSVVERWENVQGIFWISTEEDLNGKHILLIDDVLTTGSTLLSASLAITNKYDVKISILTLAVATV